MMIDITRPLPYQLFHLTRRPKGWPDAQHFRLLDASLPPLEPEQIWVENLYLSVDPYMREMMDKGWDIDTPLEGRAIGRVIASRHNDIAVGSLVAHRQGWRTHARLSGVLSEQQARVLPHYPGISANNYLGLLGGTGLTAYVALTRIAKLQANERLYISAAAGAVGIAAGQMARLLGAGLVIGSTRSASKAQQLVPNAGYQQVFNYREGQIAEQLASLAPEGLDVYLDNVGGDHLAAAISQMRDFGRIVWVGAVAQYNSVQPPAAPYNLFDIVEKNLKLEGMLVSHYRHLQPELEAWLVPHIQAGRVKDIQHITVGFAHMVSAFLGMLAGENLGKAVVKL